MNEETIIERKNQPVENKTQGQPWKAVSLGGVAGILMGAGAMYAAKAHANETSDVEIVDENATEGTVPEAHVSDSQSFSEAFDAARAEVGPGGVFHWHGGIYNTYTAAEWEAMSDSEKDAFAQRVAPEVEASAVSTPTDAQPEVVVVHHVHHVVDVGASSEATPVAQNDDVRIVATGEYEGHVAVALDVDGDNGADVVVIDVNDNKEFDANDVAVNSRGDVATIGEIVGDNQNDVAVVSEQEPTPQDDDVRVVAQTEYDGHDVYGIDLNGDNQVDVAVIDVDDSGSLSGPDVVFNGEGDYATIDELNNAADPNAGYYEVDNPQDYTSDYDPSADLMSV